MLSQEGPIIKELQGTKHTDFGEMDPLVQEGIRVINAGMALILKRACALRRAGTERIICGRERKSKDGIKDLAIQESLQARMDRGQLMDRSTETPHE